VTVLRRRFWAPGRGVRGALWQVRQGRTREQGTQRGQQLLYAHRRLALHVVDGRPAFAAEINVVAYSSGMRAGGTPIHMFVDQAHGVRGSSRCRPTQLPAAWTHGGCAEVSRSFSTASPDLQINDGNV
jgi:hypothetical protein